MQIIHGTQFMGFSYKILPVMVVLLSTALYSQSAHSNIKDPELGKRFKHISEEVMCVCGCNEPLEYCNHMRCIAWGIRGVIDELLLAGKSDEYIINGFINGYGDIVDTDASFELIRKDYSEYLEKFRSGFGEKYRTYPSKRSPQSMIIVILLIGAGFTGIFIRRRMKKLNTAASNSAGDNNPSAKKSGKDESEKEKLYKNLYD